MVTILNQNSSVELWEKYSKLFAKAYDDLLADDKLTAEEIAAGRFTSLDSYFAHMGDLLDTGKPMYMLLPLDEAPFTINANTRAVAIPSEFAKCGAVKGDNYCEIATFTVDRYFDYKDLADASIAVQWVNANKEEGISHIQLIDLESEEGKIRFGWPLTENITKYPGQIQFAVRFYVPDADDATKFTYLLNTLTSTLTVKDGLNVVDPKHIHENDYNEFKSFVKNSQNLAYTTPVSPFFTVVNGGIDLPKYGAVDLDTNELELSAQAVAKDLGAITYKWFYVPSGSTEKVEITEDNDAPTYTLTTDYVKVESIPETKGLDKYFVNTGSDEAESWTLYTGEWPPVEGTELYEVVTSLKIEDTETDVVGEYWVEAVNTIGTNSTNPSPSTHCIVPAPNKMEYTKNLKAHEFAIGVNGSAPKADLSIALKADGNNPDVSYSWHVSTTGVDGEYSKIDGADTAAYSAATAGWYKAVPVAQLNRKVESEESNICKVTLMPAAPVITKLSYKLENATDYTELTPEGEMLDVYKFGNLIYLKVDTDLDGTQELGLLSEVLTYKWYVQEPDSLPRELTEKDCGANTLVDTDVQLNSKEIKVRCVSDGAVYNYFCVITNDIQGKTAETNSSNYNTFTIA